MSTTIKRVALVAVAALGLGVLAVAPSQADILGQTLTLTPVTSSIKTGETATATINSAFLGTAAGDSVTVNSLVASKPAGSSVSLKFAVVDTAASTVTTADGSATISTGVTTAAAANSNYKLNFVSPDIAGTYVVQVYATKGSGTGTITSSVLSWSITVADVDLKSDATSTVVIASGAANNSAETSDSATVSASKVLNTQAATIYVKQKNATSTANESMTATIAGPGLLGTGTSSTNGTARAVTVKNGDYITVWSDGTSGVATVTIVGNTSGITFGTKTVTFFDTKPASVTVTVKKAYILAGATDVAGVFSVVVKDAAGNPVKSATVTAAATDTTTTVGGAVTCTYTAAKAAYICTASGKSTTKFGKVNYTFTATDGAATPTKATATADVTFSAGVAKSLTISGPASAYPGEKITLTLTATDANGYPVADQTYEGVESTGKFWSATATALPDYTVSGFQPWNSNETITTVSGVATLEINVPVTGLKAGATWTLAGDGITTSQAIDKSIAKTTVSYEVAINDPRADAATDAANEAAQAASDATDAALAAADAADAATTKAQEAVDAVATLSAEVSKLITALKAQITTLTNLVIKIQKKVKA